MGTRRHPTIEDLVAAKLEALSRPGDLPCRSEEACRKVFEEAERRWERKLHCAKFEDSGQAEAPEPRFRRQPPGEHGHGSSLL